MRSKKEKQPKTKEVRTPYDGLRMYSAITHGIGAWLATVGTAVLIVWAAIVGNALQIVSYAVYGAALIGLYATSTLYHCLPVKPKGRAALRKLDHIMIYMLIAGTYTPICLIAMHGVWGWSVFGVIWGLAVAGTIVKLFWLNSPRWISAAAYLGMGWVIIIVVVPLVRLMSVPALVFLFCGGGFYTVGGILYALKWPGRDKKYFGFHEVFHLFILLGSIAHFFMMLYL